MAETEFGNPILWGRFPHWLVGLVRPRAFEVYCALMTFARYDSELEIGVNCFPSRRRLTERVYSASDKPLSKRALDEALKELEEVGAIRVIERRGRPDGRDYGQSGNRQTANDYELAVVDRFSEDERTHGRRKARRAHYPPPGAQETSPGGGKELRPEGDEFFAPELEPGDLEPSELDEGLPLLLAATSSAAQETSPPTLQIGEDR